MSARVVVQSPRERDDPEGFREFMCADAPTTDHTIETSAGPPDGAATPAPEPGDRIGTYRIESLAGSGGMGVVYRARDEQLDRWVALKLIAPEYGRDPRFREMFLRESRAAAAIEHPNVVPVYRADEDGDRLYIAMRLVDGESLADLIARRGRIPPAQAARVLTQVAGALEAAHRRGLLHRDVKPANILVADDEEGGTAYLSDFGLATRFVQDAAGGRWAGTLAYLAPEQIRGGALDARTDVYALGCVLFQTLSGRVPFPTRDEQAAQVAHLTQAPPRVSEIAPGVPAGFDAVVARAMAKRPEDRYPSASAFAAALAALRFDAVLVHHPDDAGAAAELRAALRGGGLEVPDPAGPQELADALRASAACIVLVGAAGLDAWAREPLALAQELALRDRAFRLSAALLPGSPDPFGPGMGFLAGRAWADLRLGTADHDGRRDLLRLVREEPPPAPGDAGPEVNPYRGLVAFGERDAGFFVGREDETAQLVERLRARRFLAVIGPSGSGKSSLVAAGLVAALHGDDRAEWRIATVTPGARPLAGLAGAVAEPVPPSTGRPGAGELGTDPSALRRAIEEALPAEGAARALLVVDQFEETFTLAEAEERRAFLDALCDAVTLPGGRVWVVAVLRADFYPRCAEHPALKDLVAANQFLVGPMSPAALRRAIETPARRAGLAIESGLTRRILNDLAGRPGALPLVQHLLLELWHRRRGRELTLEAYAASGGVEGAVARRADEVFAGLTASQQGVARHTFMRLTQPGEGTEDTRRRAELRELALAPDQHADLDAVIGAFAAARLITTGRDDATGQPTAEVAHEALIRNWPRLRGWLDEARDDLRAQHRLTQAAGDWETAGRDDGLLYRGARLAEWAERGTGGLNEHETAFLQTSRDRSERERRGRRRRTRAVMASLAAGLVIVGGAGAFALVQRNSAQDQRDLARSRQLASEAVAEIPRNPEIATLLALRGFRSAPTEEAEQALRQAVHGNAIRAVLRREGTSPVLVVPAPGANGALLATAEGDLIRWNPADDPDGSRSTTLGRWDAGIATAAALPGGGVVAADAKGVVVRWTAGGGAPATIARGGPVTALAASADGRSLLIAGDDGVRLLDIASGRARVVSAAPASDAAFGPGPSEILVTSQQGTASVVSAGGGTRALSLPGDGIVQTASGNPAGDAVTVNTSAGIVLIRRGARPKAVAVAGGVTDVAFAPGGVLALAGGDGVVRILDEDRLVASLPGHDGAIATIATLPSGRVATTGTDGSARVWEWAGLARRSVQSAPLTQLGALAIDTDGAVLASLADGAVTRWEPGRGSPTTIVTIPGGAPYAAAAAPPSGRFAAGAGGTSVTVSDRRGRSIGSWPFTDLIAGLAFAPDGVTLGIAVNDGGVYRLAPGKGAKPVLVGRHEGQAIPVAVSPEDGAIVSGGSGGDVRVWGGRLGDRLLGTLDGPVFAVAVSPDGRRVAAGGGDKTARVWTADGGETALVLREGGMGEVYALAFTAGGDQLVTFSKDGVRVWDVSRGVVLLSVPSQTDLFGGAVRGSAITFYDAGNVISSVSCDVCGDIDEVLALADERTTRELTPQEAADFNAGN